MGNLRLPGLLLLLCTGLAQAQTTTITVRDRTGTAVGEARVEILVGSTVATSATTDEKGTTAVSLADGIYRARATAHGFVIGWSESFTQTADAVSTLEVTLFPGSALAGTLLDSGDERVSGAELCLSLHDWRDYPPPAFGEGLLDEGKQCWDSDDLGQMVTPVLPLGQYDLAIEAEGLVPRKTTLKLESDHAAQMWRLKRGGRITGLVRDQKENPVESATVRARHRELEAERESVTDAEGRFDATGLAPGPWTVRVEPLDAALILRDGITVKEGVATDLGLLRVRPGLGIDGVVLDANGEPLPDVEIQVREAEGVGRPLRMVKSDEEGRFLAAGLGDAPVNLLVDAPEGHASAAIEEIEPPQRNLEIELEATGTVCGVALTEDGRVAPGTSATALAHGLGLLDRYQRHVWATTREIDPETGRFCIEDVHPGEDVSVTAGAAGYLGASTTVDVLPGQEAGPVELILKRGLSLEGTVVGSDGRPILDAAVRGRDTAMVYTDSFGEFRLAGLRAGMNKVIAEHPDYAMSERDVMLPLGEGEDFRIELGAGGTIEGTVTRTGGEPVEGVPIALSSPSREQLTDFEGRFHFETVPSGERTVTRKARDRFDDFEHRAVEVVEDETIRVDFTLGVVLEGQVLRGGVPVPGVTIALAQPRDVADYTDRNHAVQRTFSDESGTYRLSGVRPGWGTVTLEDGRQTVVRQIEVPPGDSPRRDLRLPDRPIRGTVVNAADDSGIGGALVSIGLAPTDGAPQSGGSSSYSSSDPRGGIRYNLTSRAESKTTTDAAGNFEAYADALPEIKVGAWAEGFRWAEVTADPDGREPVRIELSRETKLIVKLRDPQGNPARGAEVCAIRQTDDGNRSQSCSMGGSDQVQFSLDEGTYKIQASATGFGTKVFEREMRRREDGSATTLTVDLVPGAPLDIRLVGNPVEGVKVTSLIDPTGAERGDLVRDVVVDPSTGDRRWATWTLNPGLWTLTVDDGDGEVIVREVEVAPGPPIEVVLP
jgi:protocatechuate 3,4-dioxygenase beta subunit